MATMTTPQLMWLASYSSCRKSQACAPNQMQERRSKYSIIIKSGTENRKVTRYCADTNVQESPLGLKRASANLTRETTGRSFFYLGQVNKKGVLIRRHRPGFLVFFCTSCCSCGNSPAILKCGRKETTLLAYISQFLRDVLS